MHFAPLPTGYVRDCPDRIPNVNSDIEDHVKGKFVRKPEHEKQPQICMRISNVVQHAVGVSQQTCAICMLRGDPDPQFLESKGAMFLGTLLDMAHKGWYKNSEDVLTIARKAYPYMKKSKKGLARFKELLTGCVELSRISLEQAENLVNTEMRELLDGPPEAASVGSEKKAGGCGSATGTESADRGS